jgi:hypothetical protein
VPARVDPDRWVEALDGRCYARKVPAGTGVRVDEALYYINRPLVGQYVTLRVDAAARAFVVEHAGAEVKRLPIKGLVGKPLPFDASLASLCEQARSERLRRARRSRQLGLW